MHSQDVIQAPIVWKWLQRGPRTYTLNILSMTVISCRILAHSRSFENELYKLTLYLLTYLLYAVCCVQAALGSLHVFGLWERSTVDRQRCSSQALRHVTLVIKCQWPMSSEIDGMLHAAVCDTNESEIASYHVMISDQEEHVTRIPYLYSYLFTPSYSACSPSKLWVQNLVTN